MQRHREVTDTDTRTIYLNYSSPIFFPINIRNFHFVRGYRLHQSVDECDNHRPIMYKHEKETVGDLLEIPNGHAQFYSIEPDTVQF